MKQSIFFLLFAVLLQSCIGDDIIMDFVEPEIRIDNPLDTLEISTSHQFEFTYLNNVGQSEAIIPEWSSSDENIISIDENGLATGLQIGSAMITVSYQSDNNMISANIMVNVGEETVVISTTRSGTIQTTSSYQLTGDFTIIENGNGGIDITFENNYQASSSLPGLYVYLTNNPNTTSGALEIQKVQDFQGEHTYTVENVNVNQYSHLLYFCKPFNVKVGDGEIK